MILLSIGLLHALQLHVLHHLLPLLLLLWGHLRLLRLSLLVLHVPHEKSTNLIVGRGSHLPTRMIPNIVDLLLCRLPNLPRKGHIHAILHLHRVWNHRCHRSSHSRRNCRITGLWALRARLHSSTLCLLLSFHLQDLSIMHTL